MVKQGFSDFTINFICHSELSLLKHTVPHNIRALCEGTARSYDLVLTVDGVEDRTSCHELCDAAKDWGVDEVRFRWRNRNCAGGDPSNNGHLHALSDKTPFLITLEGDVAVFRQDLEFDLLDQFACFFTRHTNIALLTKIDDFDCWVWRMAKAGMDFEDGIWSVNRVSSHFLVYNTAMARAQLGYLNVDSFYDDGSSWNNYEDLLSAKFACPNGPGIAFMAKWPFFVFHCDRKTGPQSVHYSKNTKTKVAEFLSRKSEAQKGLLTPCKLG